MQPRLRSPHHAVHLVQSRVLSVGQTWPLCSCAVVQLFCRHNNEQQGLGWVELSTVLANTNKMSLLALPLCFACSLGNGVLINCLANTSPTCDRLGGLIR